MDQNAKLSLLIIDVVGGGVVAACLAVASWFLMVGGDETAAEIKGLRTQIKDSRQTLASLERDHDEQARLLAERESALERTGQLPDVPPTEAYFKSLSTLTTQHSLQALQQYPLASCRYPGLVEDRFALELAGTLPDLVRFIWAVEHSDYWADISFLKIENKRVGSGGGSSMRVAELTFSMFSAAPVEAGEGDG
ncbi:MAG: hypothetical protein KJ749_07780 [Planctomycetes bacterium]|nr:hypothetical protein [Planctomycetota bacterium]